MDPFLTTLSYSAGVQSHCLLEMILREEIKIPSRFLVLNANPGAEDLRSYDFVKKSEERCKDFGIKFETCRGPNLYEDLMQFKNKPIPEFGKLHDKGITRLDNPPFWTKNLLTGKVGRLLQECTIAYKIAPMRRAIRRFLKKEELKFDRIDRELADKKRTASGNLKVETWIGFALDEISRVKESQVQYITLKYPLIEKKLTKFMVEKYYIENNIPKPPRSVCVFCYANGLSYLKDMCDNRPDDWEKAVEVDENIRDMSHIGVKDPCYVSATCIPLVQLEKIDFNVGKKQKDYQCNSGVCFL